MSNVGDFIRPDTSSVTQPVTGQSWVLNSTDYTIQVWNGSAWQIASAPFNNFSASTAPTTSNDHTQGYSAGSIWYNTVSGNLYVCTNPATSAAVWIQTNNLGSLTIPLSQLQQSGAAGGQSAIYNSGTGHWAPGSPTINLNQIANSGALVGQTVSWNGLNWIPVNSSGGGGGGGGLPGGAINNQVLGEQSGSPAWVYGFSGTPLVITADTSFDGSEPSVVNLVGNGGGTTTVTLPPAATVPGKVYHFTVINNIGDNVVNAQSGDHIITNTGYTSTGVNFIFSTIGYQIQPMTIISDGVSSWLLLSSEITSPISLNGNPGVLSNDGDGSVSYAQTSASNTICTGGNSTGGGLVAFQAGFMGFEGQLTNGTTTLSGSEGSYFIADTTAGDVDVNLPDATANLGTAAVMTGKVYYFNNTAGANNIVLTPFGGQTINGNSTVTLTPGKVCGIICGNSNWYYTYKPN